VNTIITLNMQLHFIQWFTVFIINLIILKSIFINFLINFFFQQYLNVEWTLVIFCGYKFNYDQINFKYKKNSLKIFSLSFKIIL